MGGGEDAEEKLSRIKRLQWEKQQARGTTKSTPAVNNILYGYMTYCDDSVPVCYGKLVQVNCSDQQVRLESLLHLFIQPNKSFLLPVLPHFTI